MKENEVKLIVMLFFDMVIVLVNGVIVGFIVVEFFNVLVEVKGVGKILWFSVDVWWDYVCCLMMMYE